MRQWMGQAGLLALAANRIGKWARTLPPPARAPIAFLAHLMFVFERNIYGIELPWQATVGRRVLIAHQGASLGISRSATAPESAPTPSS
jgi:serine O-acetyltransferase